MKDAIEAYRATFTQLEQIRGEAAELGQRIQQLATVDLPAAELAADKARQALKAAAGASALGEAQDTDHRKARHERDDAQDKVDGLHSALETLRQREGEALARERRAITEQRELAATVAEPILRERQQWIAQWQVPQLIQTLREIAMLAGVGGSGMPTGEAFKRLTGDLEPLFRAGKLELQPTGIYHTLSDGRDDITPDQLLKLAEQHMRNNADEPAA